MTIAILLTKEDIQTVAVGLHYQITTTNGMLINFTPDAVDEFINDIKAIREAQKVKEN